MHANYTPCGAGNSSPLQSGIKHTRCCQRWPAAARQMGFPARCLAIFVGFAAFLWRRRQGCFCQCSLGEELTGQLKKLAPSLKTRRPAMVYRVCIGGGDAVGRTGCIVRYFFGDTKLVSTSGERTFISLAAGGFCIPFCFKSLACDSAWLRTLLNSIPNFLWVSGNIYGGATLALIFLRLPPSTK